MAKDEKILDLMAALRDSMMNDPVRAGQRTDQDRSVSGTSYDHSGRDPRTAQAVWPLPPEHPSPPSLKDLDCYPTLDLSALPPAARPAVAAALQAAVGRLAAGGRAIKPRPAEDVVLAELVKSQMRQILVGAAEAFAEGDVNPLSFKELRSANVTRCVEVFHPIEDWSPTDWACAMAGECGEACNEVKKLRRLADGTNTGKDPQSEGECRKRIAAELADLVIYVDLLGARLGIDLGVAIQEKFDAVSVLRGSRIFLGDSPESA